MKSSSQRQKFSLRQLLQWRIEFFLLLFALGLLFYTYKVAVASIQVQMEEMEWRLQESEYLDKESSHLHLVIKYTSQRKLFKDSISQQDLDLLEFELRSQYNQISEDVPALEESHNYFQRMAIRFINFKRSLTDEIPFPDPERKLNVRYLNLAYKIERNREYQRALVLYNLMLEKPLPGDIIGSVKLHKAFCLAILGQDQPARELYHELIRAYQGDNIGITATELLSFLNEFEGEESKIASSQMDHRSKAVYLTKLLKCEEALKIIAKASRLSPQDESYLNYYKGICLEEMGEKNEAIQAYGKSIASSGKSDVAKDANRRIFMIASESKQSKSLKEMSLRINKVLRDSTLDSLEKIPGMAIDEERFQLQKFQDDVSQSDASMQNLDTQEVSFNDSTSLAVAGAPDSLLDFALDIPVDSIEQAIQAELQKPEKQKQQGPGSGAIAARMRVRVLTKSGKAFYGTLLTNSDQDIIRIKTMIGTLPIKQSEIKSVQKIN